MTTSSPLWADLPGRLRQRLPGQRLSLSCAAANGLWFLSLLRDWQAFRMAQRNVAGTQEKLLLRLIRQNSDTEFGRRWRFDAVRSVDDYRRRVPLSTYDDYQRDMARILDGAQRVLTSDPVVLLEPTSGSTGPTKLIPYTKSLKADFRRAIAPWVADMFAHAPELLSGQSYWSVSPVARTPEHQKSSIPIGFEDDSDYLGSLGRRLVQAVLAVPATVRHLEDIDTFRYVTLLFLLRSRSLSMMSVWHPTFLTLLIRPLPEWVDQLAADIAVGQITPPSAVPAELLDQLRVTMRPDPARAEEIGSSIGANFCQGKVSSSLWPRLRLISCWADGNSESYLPAVARMFPESTIQAKGLVSTEGIVSVPVHGLSGGALAVRSHFFEFLPQDGRTDGDTVLAHELERGGRYSVVMTTGGGLYRYMTHDLVDVVGYLGSCPLLRFAGKESEISDRFGEKLNARHVQQALDSELARHHVSADFAMIAFDDAGGDPAYALFVESDHASDQTLLALGSGMEEALRENYHYNYCRDLGQLGTLNVFRIEAHAHETYAKVCQENGQSIGGLKPSALHSTACWSNSFHGRFLATITADPVPNDIG